MPLGPTPAAPQMQPLQRPSMPPGGLGASAPPRPPTGSPAGPPGLPPMSGTSDGGMVVYLDGHFPGEEPVKDKPKHFDDNLAEDINEAGMGSICQDLIEGIEADIASRKEWVENYNAGMDLLGLKLDSAPVQGDKSISKVKHPLLLEAIVKGQSLARAELLPAAGPCKVRNDGPGTAEQNQRAQDLEKDMNHYLTVTATEYYPDTDRGLFYLYYGGVVFKKVYRCPLRNRPVSECVYMPDLIVSNDATDLANATRVTHQIKMQPEVIQQLQDDGFYIDVSLGDAQDNVSSTEMKEAQVTGVAAQPQRPKDRMYTIWECYTTLDLGSDDKTANGRAPYVVTIDYSNRRILSIRRNWKPDDENRIARRRFVKFGLVPGFGFLDLGYLHLLGNHTKALTALLRMTIDAGMFSSFPGGLRLKGARTSTNEFMPGPGEFCEVDGGPGITDIRNTIMPMPYKEPSAVLLSLMEGIAKDGEKIAGTVEIDVGEGRTNVPVGTMMAMVEQQTQIMAACHKRLHTSQQEELILLKELFAEDPMALWRQAKDPKRKWEKAEELRDIDLVPASDPNIPAQIHRIQQGMALVQMAQAAPTLFNLQAVAKRALKTINISDVDELLAPPAPPQQPGQGDPGAKDSAALAQAAIIDSKTKAETEQKKLQAKAMTDQGKQQLDAKKLELEASESAADRASRERIASERLEFDRQQAGLSAMTEQAKLAQQDAHKGIDVSQQAAQREQTDAHKQMDLGQASDFKNMDVAANESKRNETPSE